MARARERAELQFAGPVLASCGAFSRESYSPAREKWRAQGRTGTAYLLVGASILQAGKLD